MAANVEDGRAGARAGLPLRGLLGRPVDLPGRAAARPGRYSRTAERRINACSDGQSGAGDRRRLRIGRAISLGYVREGARVVAVDRDEAGLKALGDSVTPIVADITDPEQVRGMVAARSKRSARSTCWSTTPRSSSTAATDAAMRCPRTSGTRRWRQPARPVPVCQVRPAGADEGARHADQPRLADGVPGFGRGLYRLRHQSRAVW